MYKLVMMRHGESQWNRENRFTGWVDVDITQAGAAEAVAAGVWLHGRAGRHAGHGAPVTATDIAAAVPEAIASVRSVES